MNQLKLFTASVLLFAMASAFGQACCGGGSGSGAPAGNPYVKQGTILLQPGFDWNYSKVNILDKEGLSLMGAFGVTNWLNISVKANVAWMKAGYHHDAGTPDTSYTLNPVTSLPETTIIPGTPPSAYTDYYKNFGLGDGNVGLQLIPIIMTPETNQEIKFGSSVGIPWAAAKKVYDSQGFEAAKVRVGSGGWSVSAFTSYTRDFPEIGLSAAAVVSGQTFAVTKYRTRPGNTGTCLLTVTESPLWNLRLIMSASYSATAETIDSAGGYVEPSGGHRWDLIPSVQFVCNQYVKISGEAQFPLWRDYNQTQVGTSLSLRASALVYIPVFKPTDCKQ